MSDNAVPTMDVECAIIGGGPAGLTAALYLARFRRQVVVLDGRQSRAELIPVSQSYPGFPPGVSGVELLGRLRKQAMHYGVRISNKVVKSLQLDTVGFLLYTDGQLIRTTTTLLATGVIDRQPEIAGIREAYLGRHTAVVPYL